LSPIAIYNYPTVAALAQWLATPALTSDTTDTPAMQASIYSNVAFDSETLLAQVRGMSEQDMEGFIAQELAKQQDP
jgi:hypothetical protein